MTDRKPVTLDDLNRDELLSLAQSHGLWLESDLVWAQWMVASARALKAQDAVVTFLGQIGPAAKAFDAAHKEFDPQASVQKMDRALKKIEVARAEYRRVEAEYSRLSAKAGWCQRRANRLYRLYEELPR